ncbi:MAG: cobaltochelatase subunit CobN [Acidimicrobiales bacterium]
MILFFTNADTEILALRVATEGLPAGFPPVRVANPSATAVIPPLDGVQAVLVRLLGGRSAWEEPFDMLVAGCAARDIPLLAFGGEGVPDAELASASTVKPGLLAKAFSYLVAGGAHNMDQLLRFVAASILGGDFDHAPPEELAPFGVLGEPVIDPSKPTVGVVFYRAHLVSGNTRFVEDLCDALVRSGANAVPVFCYSLRPQRPSSAAARLDAGELGASAGRVPALELLASYDVDAVITTVLAAGSALDGGDGWDATALVSLDVPILQAVAATSSSESWQASPAALTPIDVAMSVAIPEFDGRIISTAFSFKEMVDDGADIGSPVFAYRAHPERTSRVAGLAVRHGLLRRSSEKERKVAIVVSAYPTKSSRLGNAVGLDTPASLVKLLEALNSSGYRLDQVPTDSDELMRDLAVSLSAARAAADGQSRRTPEASGAFCGRMPEDDYRSWFTTLPDEVRSAVIKAWGPPPGDVFTAASKEHPGKLDFVFPGIDLGGVLVALQPPRGFGENPVAIYHSPDLAPTHHYLAFYHWLDARWGAKALVHLGKHGTLEWLPGKGVGLSASCFPDVALRDMPLVYPFVVNDPGEGVQAKRRSHAVIVDHLIPVLTRAETYDDLAALESLLDTHAQVLHLDPAKLPEIRREVWQLLVESEIHSDLGLDSNQIGNDGPSFEDPAFDDVLLEVDGYLCELKDAQIRGGLHVLGEPPCGEAELDMVLAITRLRQGSVPSLRETVAAELGVDISREKEQDVGRSDATRGSRRSAIDSVEAECRTRLSHLQASGWDYEGEDPTLCWVAHTLVPALRATPRELSSTLHALGGGHVPSGPSGAPSRGMAHVLPTGRNFYSVDPKALPSPFAWKVGCALADRLLERHLAEEGTYPRTVGLVMWGTAAMRTAGDDIAEALYLMGVRPKWADESGRVEGLEVISLEELGRPRIDVVARISGFFRDALISVVEMMDEAACMVAELDENEGDNFVKANGSGDPRIFGPKPGAYGSGILPLIESGAWEDDADLTSVYLAWGGYSYARSKMGLPASEAMRRRLAAVDVAAKNQDNREHDIFDSDDYFQEHGGMVAAIRFLSGRNPKAWFGDSSDPFQPRVRTLQEEARRVVRTRVINPKWIDAMRNHGYKGAFEMAATVDYLFGYDVTAQVVDDWMYERVTRSYVADPASRRFFQESNPWALKSIVERLLEANSRGLWDASQDALQVLQSALLESEGWEEEVEA